jgi:glycosyltransferase involved in cell wall biosynthesis
MVTNLVSIGGTEFSSLILSKVLKKRGHQIYVMVNDNPFAHEFIKEDIPVIQGEVVSKSLMGIIKGSYDIRKCLSKIKIDIIHTHLVAPTLMSFLARAILLEKPLIIWHDRGIQEKSYSIVAKLFNHLTDFVITNSNYEKNKLIANGLNPDKIKTIHNCITIPFPVKVKKDDNLLHEFNINKDETIVGTARRLHPEKGGHYDFLQAATLVLKKNPNVKFLIAGDGPLRKELEYKAKELNISEKIIFTGFRRDIENIYSILDIFVLPSTWEPFGNALIEAMSFATPCVGTKVGGIPEIIIDGETGILIPAENFQKLAEAIIYLLENPDVAKRMGEAGRERVRNYFTPERLAFEMEQVYFSLFTS